MMLDFSGVRLPKKVLVLWRLNSLLASTILVILAVCAGFFWWPGEIFTAVTLFFSAVVVGNLVLDVFVLARLRHRAYCYEDACDFLRVRTGYLFAKQIVIPVGQILYVDLQQGPLSRRLELCKVNVGTLGSVHEIGPIEESRAQEISEKYGGVRKCHET